MPCFFCCIFSSEKNFGARQEIEQLLGFCDIDITLILLWGNWGSQMLINLVNGFYCTEVHIINTLNKTEVNSFIQQKTG